MSRSLRRVELTPGYMLHHRPWRDTSRIIEVLTREHGRLTLFAVTGLSHLLRPPFYWRMFLRSLVEIGYFSLPVVALTAIFTGMVLALQSYTGFARFSAESAIATISSDPGATLPDTIDSR